MVRLAASHGDDIEFTNGKGVGLRHGEPQEADACWVAGECPSPVAPTFGRLAAAEGRDKPFLVGFATADGQNKLSFVGLTVVEGYSKPFLVALLPRRHR